MIKSHNRSSIFVVPAMAMLTVSAPSLAQDAPSMSYTSFEATSAKPVQLGYYGAAHRDCTPAPTPTIRVSSPPKSGTFTIRAGQMQMAPTAPCPGLKIPAQIVFYQARVGATGTDHLIYEVINASNKVDAYDVTINIKEPPKGSATDPDKPI